MSTFEVKARKIEIIPHPNADKLELAKVDGYTAAVAKGMFSSGDIAIYIPEGAIVPFSIQKEMGLEGRLSGGTLNPDGSKQLDRVKAIRLRGMLSQGLVYRPQNVLLEQDKDYQEELNITKYRPPVPLELAGKVDHDARIETYTDIENIKRYPDMLKPEMLVRATEKIHGTMTALCRVENEFLVSSKGISQKSQVLLEAENNVYWRSLRENKLDEALIAIQEELAVYKVILYGETFGVQDLNYGLQPGEVAFRAFDIKVQTDINSSSRYLDTSEFDALCTKYAIQTAPVLFEGKMQDLPLQELTEGKETVSGHTHNIREGIVIKTLTEQYCAEHYQRCILKSISEAYLTRKGVATEYE